MSISKTLLSPVKSTKNQFDSLTRQSQLVALAALAPFSLALWKYRFVDAAVLALSGMLSVYNMSCISSGKRCTTWAWILSISYALMVAFEVYMPTMPKPEMLKSKKEKEEEEEPVPEAEAAEKDDEILDEEDML